jgi:hypothetical protein
VQRDAPVKQFDDVGGMFGVQKELISLFFENDRHSHLSFRVVTFILPNASRFFNT